MLEQRKGVSVTTETLGEHRLLGMTELSTYLNVPRATLYAWRSHGDGPRGIKVGRHVRYRPEDVEKWLDARSDGAS